MRRSRRDVLKQLGGAAATCLGQNVAHAAVPSAADGISDPHNASDPEDRQQLLDYFDSKAPLLFRPAEGILQWPSIAPSLPGKTYSAQLWDWDTYWTARGLFALARLKGDDAFKKQVAEHAKGSLLDFLHSQSADGRLPIMMNAQTRDFFNSFDPKRNQAKPTMAQLALLVTDETGDVVWLDSVFVNLIRFHDSWRSKNMSKAGLLVWSNGIAIGNDNDPTASGRPPFSSAHLLLNCLYSADLRAMAQLAKRLDRKEDHERLVQQAESFEEMIRGTLWDPRDSFFYSHDVMVSDDRFTYIPTIPRGMDFSYKSLPMRIATFTGFLPLWCGIATQEQAKLLLDSAWRKDDRFQANYGCRTLSARETMYSLVASGNPSNWLGPIWIIANYFTWKALQNYGTEKEADVLAQRTIRLLADDLRKNGSLNEYYHPDTGAALSHTGFMDWNLLVLEMIESLHSTKPAA